MLVDWFWFSLVLSLLLLWLLWHWPQLWPHLQTTTVAAARVRLLKPRTPAECPTCRQARATATDRPPTRIPVTPWRERKSRRGAPKRILTQGFAWPNRSCLYYQITDAYIHALVGDGAHGQHERIQTLRCQACGTTFSTRRGYPLGDTTIPFEFSSVDDDYSDTGARRTGTGAGCASGRCRGEECGPIGYFYHP